MGHDKLRKFAENESFGCLLQPRASDVLSPSEEPGLHLKDHPVKGHWCERMFAKDQPIVLELGCGKGDYTVALAQRHPECNYIGVDIKGARLWKGAKYATEHRLPNVAFLRTRIEFIGAFFGPGEVSEIWLTFSDPQMKSENSRLTSPLFLERYRAFLAPGGTVHLKTDSRFLHEYTQAVAVANGLTVTASSIDIYGSSPTEDSPVRPDNALPEVVTSVQTFYERMFLDMGLPITYMAFRLDHEGPFAYPEFDGKYWRAFEGTRRSFGHGGTGTE